MPAAALVSHPSSTAAHEKGSGRKSGPLQNSENELPEATFALYLLWTCHPSLPALACLMRPAAVNLRAQGPDLVDPEEQPHEHGRKWELAD